ncbi:0717732a-afe8-4fa4-bf25-da2708ee9d81 [Thermothielavioides terrestris]
MEEER